jgi:putative inorganic carbon (hco3(-)) transporter
MLAETGALGFLCYMAIVWITVQELHRVVRRSRPGGRGRRTRAPHTASQGHMGGIAAGYLFAIVAYLTTGFFLSLSYQRYFWLVLALGAAAAAVAVGKSGFAGEGAVSSERSAPPASVRP